jgi:hypothetical protein
MRAVPAGSVSYLQFVLYCQATEHHVQCTDFEDGDGTTEGRHSEEVKCENNYIYFTFIGVTEKHS